MEEQLKEMELIIDTEGIASQAMMSEQLEVEVGAEASSRTIQRTLGTKDYWKCLAC